MKFFNQVVKHPKEFKRAFDKNVSKKDLDYAYRVGQQGARADKRSEKAGLYILPHTFIDKSGCKHLIKP